MTIKRVRPILVESKEYSIIHKFGDCLDTHAELQKWNGSARPIYQELILISLEDEKIEEGDKFVHYWFNENSTNKDRIVVSTADENTNDKKHRKSFIGKVIARQSQISPEYISKFIEQYNNDCVEDFKIEMKTKTYQPCDNNYEKCGEPFNIDEPKLHNGFVIIVEKENKFGNSSGNVSLDDINNLLHSHSDFFIGLDSFRRLQKDIIELFKSYKEPISYTEEEVKRLCSKVALIHFDPDNIIEQFDNWFENNKKK